MIICPTCQHQEVAGALFCSECGAQLYNMGSLATHNIQTNEIRKNGFDAPPPMRSAKPTTGTITLQVLDGGQVIPLADRSEFTMGRVSDEQIIMPDIDLTPYRAYEYGVSRLHAVLKKKKEKVTLMDLNSSNGTYVDGLRLDPELEVSLSHGCIISLGKLRLQFLLQN